MSTGAVEPASPAAPVFGRRQASRRIGLDELAEARGSGRLGDLRARFADAFSIIRHDAADADRTGGRQTAGITALIASGFTRLRVAEADGGIDIPLVDLFALLADLGAADPGVANALRGHLSFIEVLRHQPDVSPEARAHWTAEIVSGRVFGNAQTSAPGAPVTTARRTASGEWVVSGRKYYSSGSLYADYIRASAEDEDGRPVWAIVPTDQPGVERADDWRGFGQRTSASGSTLLSEARVHPLGIIPIDQEVAQHQSFVQLYHLATLSGITREVLDEAIALNVSRPPRKEAFGDHALDVVGSLSVSYVTAQSLVRTAADVLEHANALFLRDGDREPYERLSVYTLANQVAVIETALEATTRLFDAAGASLTDAGKALDRHWRNARTIASHNPVAVKPRLLGDYLVNGRFYGSPFSPFDADGAPSEVPPFRPGE
ncbi:hypothetical protein N8K70_01065 [Microbacterium betulae]|uniref:Acyl-CoA dehydrogenase n=1 Tax=Microbacterium betulae TaxID=2981139 RepID=A0AA97FH18_9MICO|nr:acyl-CoA dehydrogenase family protein [Microbacterium sp. AB]WOF23291.1 hypothetical protein N8K70_01065 [Microbacterium sp. AB]